ncbi:MAG: class I SAM-dependent DNA methyltransferase, partial [Bacteroidales bacterium]|nr:class I SAM-dependent DNA methyltransferase [Bacteroidales bacterium]
MATLWDAYENESLQDVDNKDISDKSIKQNLVAQTKFWNAQQGYEKGKTQQFWNSILKCFNPDIDLAQTVVYEKQVKDPHSQSTKFIDAYITTTNVLIEQKSSHVALDRPEPQSDGTALTPFQQAERYDNWLPLVEKARYIVCSNFRTIEIHDRNKPLEPPTVIPFTPDGVSRNYYRLKFLLDKESTVTALETAVSKNAALLIGELYNDIIALYNEDEITPTLLHDLNVFCVRMVFCFYAEDSLVFSKKDMFGNFLQDFHHKRSAFRAMLKCLFTVLNTPYEQRDSEEKELNQFPYINGGLFEKQTQLPRFTENIAYSITQKISLGFDWSPINPAIFGAMFESTLSSDDRREGGMHYTTTDNIDKALAPLFLDGLRQKLDAAVKIADPKQKRDTLLALQDTLASIRILDPACGSGNFLTYAYMELRRIENKILYELLTAGFLSEETLHATSLQSSLIKVSLSQFYGFEINDFAVDVAKTALWISQNQMLHETQQILGTSLPELPLCNIETFHCVNSLRIKWEDYVKPQDLDYIVGNPPFVGARLMNAAQKEDIVNIFGNDWKNIGNMDYVTCWYKKAYDYIQHNPKIRCAFVSTNSICQGEQVATLWKPLFEGGLTIDFAYRTFRWESDSVGMAHVHCVIVGFSLQSTDVKRIYNPDGTSETAKNINAYLMDAPNVFIDSRNKPICNVPEMVFGNMPNDGGNLIIEENDYSDFVK